AIITITGTAILAAAIAAAKINMDAAAIIKKPENSKSTARDIQIGLCSFVLLNMIGFRAIRAPGTIYSHPVLAADRLQQVPAYPAYMAAGRALPMQPPGHRQNSS